MDPRPILPSATDLERRRLESTIDQDLHSLSLGSLVATSASIDSHPTHSNNSLSSISSIEYPRGFGEGDTGRSLSLAHPSFPHHFHHHGPHGTPRAAARKPSAMSAMSEMDSPVSTAGHHVSAVTLGEGVFRNGLGDITDGDEFDPERSLGRLVGELGKVMGGRISPRPISPFAALSPPRSPSPFSSMQHPNAANLSLTLNRNDPLPSPPMSRSGSRSSGESVRLATKSKQSSRFTSMARDLGNDIKVRAALGESTAYNALPAATPGPKSRKVGEKENDRVRALQGERRTSSAPARIGGEADVTGMTGLMETPAKGGDFGDLGKNGKVGGEAGAAIPHTLATLHARLRALETENSLSRRRVRELEIELEKARGEVESARRAGDGRLREVIGEKSALEDLIKSLRSHLTRLTVELEQNKAIVSELRSVQSQPAHLSPPRPNNSVRDELVALRREVERLGNEVHRLGGIVEEGLDTRRKARGERTIRMEEDEAAKAVKEVQMEEEVQRIKRVMEKRKNQLPPPTPGPSKLRQGLHASAAEKPTLMPPSAAPVRTRRISAQQATTPASDDGFDSPTPTSHSARQTRSRRSPRLDGPASPFPSIRAEDEHEFFAAMAEPDKRAKVESAPRQTFTTAAPIRHISSKAGRPAGSSEFKDGDIPPQTVLTRVIAELETDFAHYKAIYAELADQYKVLDAASAVAKRRVLAEHLKEVIDTLEQKADQIASLYDLLTYKDRPVGETNNGTKVHKSVPDILRLVKESLGEDGLRRLEEDGVGVRTRRRHAAM